jgi:hypothetical protein
MHSCILLPSTETVTQVVVFERIVHYIERKNIRSAEVSVTTERGG